jgi:hypothetical protein
MSQYDFGTIDPNTKSGTALATDLNSWRNALHSTHGGSSAPSYITAGMLWADTTSANYELKMYDSAQSITVAVIDATNNVARVAVDSAETSYITSTTAGQIQHIISGSAKVTVNSTGVGIGTTAPTDLLQIEGGNILIGTDSGDPFNANSKFRIQGAGNEYIQIKGDSTGSVGLLLGDATDNFTAGILSSQPEDNLIFHAGNQERARIDSDGNLMVGKTASGTATVGGELRANGSISGTADGAVVAFFNRTTSDGPIVNFRKDNTTIGNIGTAAVTSIYFGSGDTTLTCSASGDAIVPTGTDGATRSGAIDLGNSGNRWDTVFATVGTINTSDRTEKQDIEELNDAERRVAVACKGLLRKYRLKSAIAKKGEDARIHFGIIAQDLQAAFEAESLDAGRYGMFINSTWTDEETGEEKSLMGVRYSELLAFIIAAM